MPIVAEAGPSAQEYIELNLEQHIQRPEGCLSCLVQGEMIGHGYYIRNPKDLGRGWVLRVKRWKCQARGKPVGAVPSFLLFYRHYLLAVIQAVVVRRFELCGSWANVTLYCVDEGVPALRTMQRWCGRLAEQAPEWLGVLEKVLAEQDSTSEWLNPQGEAGQKSSSAQALLRKCQPALSSLGQRALAGVGDIRLE